MKSANSYFTLDKMVICKDTMDAAKVLERLPVSDRKKIYSMIKERYKKILRPVKK